MSVESLAAYLNASSTYKGIDDRVRHHARNMRSLYTMVLSEPGSTQLEGSPEATPYRGTMHGRDHAIDSIVDGETLFSMLEDWRVARNALNDAWAALPAEMRQSAKEPPAAYDRQTYR